MSVKKLFTPDGRMFNSIDDANETRRHELFMAQVAAERQRQIAKGYTAEHDREHGVDHLLAWAAHYAEKGDSVKSAALIGATRELLAAHDAEVLMAAAEAWGYEHMSGWAYGFLRERAQSISAGRDKHEGGNPEWKTIGVK